MQLSENSSGIQFHLRILTLSHPFTPSHPPSLFRLINSIFGAIVAGGLCIYQQSSFMVLDFVPVHYFICASVDCGRGQRGCVAVWRPPGHVDVLIVTIIFDNKFQLCCTAVPCLCKLILVLAAQCSTWYGYDGAAAAWRHSAPLHTGTAPLQPQHVALLPSTS